MKKLLSFIMVFTTIITVTITPFNNQIHAAQISEIDYAQQVGESFIAKRIQFFPEWKGASLSDVQTYYNLNGQKIAYLFSIEKADIVIGRIVIGSSAYNYHVFEAGAASPPYIPTSSEIALDIEKEVGIKAEDVLSEFPKLIYLGYDSYAAIYQTKFNEVAYDLRYYRVVQASELKSRINTPGQYQEMKTEIDSFLQLEFNDLPVPVRNMADPVIPEYMRNDNNCGPTSGAMIAEYYKQYRGYYGFEDWAYDHNSLYYTMSTNNPPWPGGTLPWNAGTGFVTYAAECGYNFNTGWLWPIYSDYNGIKGYINTQRPIMILFWGWASYAQWHYCAIRGYWADEYGWDLIINNPWGYADFVSWDIDWGGVTLHLLSPN